MLPNDSVLVTPGSGATIASELVSSKEYEVWIAADHVGELVRARDAYLAWFDASAGLATDFGEAYWDIFNASGSGKIVRVHRILNRSDEDGPNGSLGNSRFEFCRTTGAGTSGTTVTPRPLDTDAPALPSQITMRTLPGLTPAFSTVLVSPHYRDLSTDLMVLEMQVHRLQKKRWHAQTIVLREGEGLSMKGGGASPFNGPRSLVMFSVE